ncbi:MAG: SDR family oxidoreductase [Acidimicrobiales bacterium]|nr:SDR family oxidoreductase [Acidimicrobiales bacterium]
MVGRLEGKVAVITGGASGIGAATVRRFVAEGARVMFGDLQDGPGEELAASLGAAAAYRHANVAHEADVAALIGAAADRWGTVDVVFNNAGFVGATGSLEDTSEAEYDLTMNVLLKSVFFGIKHAAPLMKAQGSGSIVSTSSVCGITPSIGTHLYNVAKAGVVMMTKSLALELAEWNIRVNCICPGYVATGLAAGGNLTELGRDATAARLDQARERMARSQPMQRMGEPEDVAALVTFLASDESNWLTGTAQVIDGGLTLGKPWRRQPAAVTEHRPLPGA